MTASDRKVSHYARRTVYPYSAHYRALFDRAGVSGQVRDRAAFARIPPTDLGDVSDPGALVLRPDLRAIVREGRRPFAVRAAVAKLAGGMHQFNKRVVEHHFKPVHWVIGEGVPIGYSSADLVRLASYGQAWLERAGVGRNDVVLSLLHPGPTVAHWQLVLGCRRARVSAIHLDPAVDPAWAERLAPSVLVGDPQQLVTILARARASGHQLANLRTVLAVGDPLSAELRERLHSLAGGAPVVAAWAPPGVRALWTECRESVQASSPTGYHAWDADFLEVAPQAGGAPGTGELLWTGLGWRGSAVLRLRTHTSVTVQLTQCGACGRSEGRVLPLAPLPRTSEVAAAATQLVEPVVEAIPPEPVAAEVTGTEAVLDAENDVAAWQVEHRRVNGSRETIVVLAPAWGAAVVPLVRRLDRHFRATQFVVLTAEEVAERVDAAGGRRIVGDDSNET